MTRLVLAEYKTQRGVCLSVDERDAIRRLHGGIRIEPTVGSDGRYDITADQRVGVICLPTRVIEIRPKIPMSSVLYMVSQACGGSKWFNGAPEYVESADLVSIIAIMLARSIERATRRGLLNGYQVEEAALPAPRGRVRFDEQLRRRMGVSPPIEVRHDEFTSDILENRLLLAALWAMSSLTLHETGRRELSRAQRLFGSVSLQHYPPASLPEVVFTRLNEHYRPAVSLALLVLRSRSIDLGVGAIRGSAFLIDMNDVFEQFVRVELRRALGSDLRELPDRGPPLHLDRAARVPMYPDFRLMNDGQATWVGDAKYKRLPPGAYRNADLYQLLAYCIALDLPEGTLIYAADDGDKAAEHVTAKCDKRLRVVALDLSVPPLGIRKQMDAIALRVRSACRLQQRNRA